MNTQSKLISPLGSENLLPNEPRIIDEARQYNLTKRFLMPALRNIETLFLDLRTRLDPKLSGAQPVKNGKPYPLGQCLEISLAVQKQLQRVDIKQLSKSGTQGYKALVAFQRHGGVMRQVWGDLRGQYFQNAFLIGSLYVDTSNDTVVPTKPKVEILPFAEARFSPVRDFRHFAQIAAQYWRAQIFPNHLIPSLAPYFPLISVVPNEGVQLQNCSDYMLALARRDAFVSSEAVLATAFENEDLFQLLSKHVSGSTLEIAQDAQQGRELAVQYCRQYRADGRHHSDEQRKAAIKSLIHANNYLARLTVQVVGQKVA